MIFWKLVNYGTEVMGDPRRFSAFADLIARNVAPQAVIADVAGGKGALRAELSRRGFGRVDTWDTRHKNASGRRGYVYGKFDWRNAPRYDAIVAMHPDEGTDHAIMAAARMRVPCIVCPCCVKPSASKFSGNQFEPWLEHLAAIIRLSRMEIVQTTLPIHGRNIVLIGRPVK